jgi:hypothetical protein
VLTKSTEYLFIIIYSSYFLYEICTHRKQNPITGGCSAEGFVCNRTISPDRKAINVNNDDYDGGKCINSTFLLLGNGKFVRNRDMLIL